MDIRLKPELEKMVEQVVRRGAYQTADEFVERAVVLLHEQESWMAEHAEEIGAKIAEGYEAAKRGELMEPEQARVVMNEKKSGWRANKRA
jgi:putative addiction module CopG family antidote